MGDKTQTEILLDGIKEYFGLHLTHIKERIDTILDCIERTDKDLNTIKDRQTKLEIEVTILRETDIALLKREIKESNTRISDFDKFKTEIEGKIETLITITKKKKLSPAFILATLCASPVMLLIFQALFKKLGWF